MSKDLKDIRKQAIKLRERMRDNYKGIAKDFNKLAEDFNKLTLKVDKFLSEMAGENE